MKTKEIDWKYKKIKGCSNQVPEDFRVSGTSQELVETVAKHKKIKETLTEIDENQRKSKNVDWKYKKIDEKLKKVKENLLKI